MIVNIFYSHLLLAGDGDGVRVVCGDSHGTGRSFRFPSPPFAFLCTRIATVEGGRMARCRHIDHTGRNFNMGEVAFVLSLFFSVFVLVVVSVCLCLFLRPFMFLSSFVYCSDSLRFCFSMSVFLPSSTCLAVCKSVSDCLSECLFQSFPVCVCLSVRFCISVFLFLSQCVCLSLCMSPPVYPCVCHTLFVCVPV